MAWWTPLSAQRAWQRIEFGSAKGLAAQRAWQRKELGKHLIALQLLLVEGLQLQAVSQTTLLLLEV
jgi:hypothetical protein